MRKAFNAQMNIDEVNIADITFDIRSRDAIPKLQKGYSIFISITHFVTKFWPA
ncbi:MAG: hypothetical protein OFPII_36200 [Osedax symbiont Rs1]|nr:MAG: hypothetical protein OFPII_36200 [Osedax symbiont Rs1]